MMPTRAGSARLCETAHSTAATWSSTSSLPRSPLIAPSKARPRLPGRGGGDESRGRGTGASHGGGVAQRGVGVASPPVGAAVVALEDEEALLAQELSAQVGGGKAPAVLHVLHVRPAVAGDDGGVRSVTKDRLVRLVDRRLPESSGKGPGEV